MDDGQSIPFSALLAGNLLIKKDISNIELINSICLFEEQMNLCVIGDEGLSKLDNIVKEDDEGFHLIVDYNDRFNNMCTIKEYLYSMTNPMIRSFFGYQEELKINDIGSEVNKRKGIFKKIRTRVLH